VDPAVFLQALRRRRVVAIARGGTPERLVSALGLLADEGIGLAEVSLSHPAAIDGLAEAARRLSGRVLLGAGTVLEARQAEAAARAGARFIVTPGLIDSVQRAARHLGLPIVTGAFTPTEILAALEAGAAAVKLFPASVGGVAYLHALRAPLPDVPLVPVGGIGPQDAGAYLAAGAHAVGVGGPLFGDALAGGDLDGLRARARALRHATDGPS
jgi:2-dehydro-3-deoxyphosphogluconate aldolase/(4S)-4-hydroxy-2-oxoglutarate aldolase